MTTKKWSDVRPVEGPLAQPLDRAHERNQAYIDGNWLAQRRTELGLTQ